jgi:hypothetical protein
VDADWAAQLGQLEAVKVLLTAPDADVLVKNSFGVSAVTEAMKKNRDDIASTCCSAPHVTTYPFRARFSRCTVIARVYVSTTNLA